MEGYLFYGKVCLLLPSLNKINNYSKKMQKKNIKRSQLSVIILTYNEKENIAQALDSVISWSDEVIILDSYSVDGTLDIVSNYECNLYQHNFENFSKQRNYALKDIPIKNEWILFLDADEWVTEELKVEIDAFLESNPTENGAYLNRKFLWMGKWIKRGYYPTWTLRLFRHKESYCEDRSVNEHIVVSGELTKLKNHYIHQDQKSIGDWISKHNARATLEADELYKRDCKIIQKEISVKLFGNQVERKRWIRYYFWEKIPILIRPILYFLFRYVFKMGFLDGKRAFTYHFLQALWFPMLIDIKYLEKKLKKNYE